MLRGVVVALAAVWLLASLLATAQAEPLRIFYPNRIIARYLGSSLEDPAVVGESLRGIHLYDGEENRAYFGTPDRPGQIYETMQRIIDVWSSLSRLKVAIAPANVIAHDVWE
jgi:hypothetical protein